MLAMLEDVEVNRGSFSLRIDSLKIPRGVTLVIGPNGSGKSTLVRLLVGRIKPNRGKIKRFFKNPGYAPQRDYIKRGIPMRVIDAMRLVATEEKAREALEAVKLEHKAFDIVTSLSGGERQRLLIARSIAIDSDAFFWDEPFAGCDFESKLMILEVIKKLYREKPFFIVTHDPNPLIDLSNAMIVMHRGNIAYIGPPREITRETLCEVYGPSCKILRRDDKIFLRLWDQH